ncbi:hypothetical protein BH18ACT15_BH18ACT15_11000 [soil metagenome]
MALPPHVSSLAGMARSPQASLSPEGGHAVCRASCHSEAAALERPFATRMVDPYPFKGETVGSRIYTVTVDCAAPERLATFWAEVLGYRVAFQSADEWAIEDPDDECSALLFVRVPDAKSGKNRIHLDLVPDDQAAEIARVKSLGARPVDIGQQDVTWVVLADPEGNEFCILTPRHD